uniref:G_PROTEIN_RECEP_F1_2 domain-containing protein n=1 Tax=Rhabditophanes sp. KR3021 TaxID=114890 RepID=A0AC35TZU2_9BILA
MADEQTFLNAYSDLLNSSTIHHHTGHHGMSNHFHHSITSALTPTELILNATTAILQTCSFQEWTTLPDRASLLKICSIISVLALLDVIVIFGNFMVIVAVMLRRRLRTATGYLILSLAVADLLVGMLILPFSMANEILNNFWIFGETWCTFWLTVDIWMSTASIWNLVAISIDRYIAIIKPLNYPMIVTKFRARCIVAAVWIGSFIICSPSFILASSNKSLPCKCTPADAGNTYIIFSASSSFFVPMIIVVFVYARIYVAACAATRSAYSGTMAVPNTTANGAEGKNLKSLIMLNPASLSKGTEEMPMLRVHRGSTVNALYCGRVDSLRVHNGQYTRDRTVSASYICENGTYAHDKLLNTPNPLQQIKDIKKQRPRSVSPRTALQKQMSDISNTHNSDSKNIVRSASSAICKFIKRNPKKKAGGMLEKRLSIEIKAAKTVAIVTGCFIFCWLGFAILYGFSIKTSDAVWSIVFWLGYVNSAANPVIYTVFNREFRSCFKKLLTCQHWTNNSKADASKIIINQANSVCSSSRQIIVTNGQRLKTDSKGVSKTNASKDTWRS